MLHEFNYFYTGVMVISSISFWFWGICAVEEKGDITRHPRMIEYKDGESFGL